MAKEKTIKLDSEYIIKLIKSSSSNRDLGKKINKYYKYIKSNL